MCWTLNMYALIYSSYEVCDAGSITISNLQLRKMRRGDWVTCPRSWQDTGSGIREPVLKVEYNLGWLWAPSSPKGQDFWRWTSRTQYSGVWLTHQQEDLGSGSPGRCPFKEKDQLLGRDPAVLYSGLPLLPHELACLAWKPTLLWPRRKSNQKDKRWRLLEENEQHPPWLQLVFQLLQNKIKLRNRVHIQPHGTTLYAAECGTLSI